MIFTAVWLAVALLLFLAGMQMSAFFSGSETGFYRVSQLQLTLQKQHGDTTARQLVEFIDHPARFVSTTLVGNNVANYLTTLAIGLFVAEVIGQTGPAGTVEIASTLLMAPAIFVFGELIPKSLYYRAPLSLLRQRHFVFRFFYFVFLPLSFPLTMVASAISRLTGQDSPSVDTMFGRTRMFGLIASGKRDGVITQIQGRLADNLMHSGNHLLAEYMEALDVLPTVHGNATRDTILATAEAHGIGWVLLSQGESSGEETRAIRVSTLLMNAVSPRTASEIVPRYGEETHPLVALSDLFRQHAHFGLVIDEDTSRPVGLIRRDRLGNQLLISQTSPRPPKTAWEV